MDLSVKILSDIAVYEKYARYLPEKKRKETWEEIVTRNKSMHIRKFPFMEDMINEAYQYVYERKVLPSMRSMQFAGKPIEISPNRIYNCGYTPVDCLEAFPEIMFLLLGGTGVGFSVQQHHIRSLPEIRKPKSKREKRYLVGDSIEGWADAVKVLFDAYFNGGNPINFDFSDIRPKGSLLITSGGKAPGPGPLRECLIKIQGILENKNDGDKLRSIEIHDIVCHIANSVLAGGIRRAALISLFSCYDEEMVCAKSGNFGELNPQRYRSNNSAVFLRHKVTEKDFMAFWKRVEQFGFGEPGIFFTHDKDWGTNPCCEIALPAHTFCNLVELNGATITTNEELVNHTVAATTIATLQASYTDFHYLRPCWQEKTEKEALIGIGITGVASGKFEELDLEFAAKTAIRENNTIAYMLGINPAARLTTIKPSGTTSCVLGTSSGIHAWHAPYYLRRMQIEKSKPIYKYLKEKLPELVKDYHENPSVTAVIEVPQKAPERAIYRTESPLKFLERVKYMNQAWIRPGHVDGQNTNNISATVSIKPRQWDMVGRWMWRNKEYFNGLSVMPYDTSNYKQTPFEDISKAEYERLLPFLAEIDLSQVIEEEDNSNFTGEIACGANGCELK